jgi:hypothetical protein
MPLSPHSLPPISPSQDFDLDAVIASSPALYPKRAQPTPGPGVPAAGGTGTGAGPGTVGSQENWAVTTYLTDEQYEILRYCTALSCPACVFVRVCICFFGVFIINGEISLQL